MPTPATVAAASASVAALASSSSPLLRRYTPLAPPPRRPPPILLFAASRRRVACQVAVTSDVSSSPEAAAAAEEEEAAAAEKIGRRIRVKAPLKVYHVAKAPDLDLCGMEGTIKQYVGVWKGKRISANLPFKVEFVLPDGVEGRPGPVKFFAHLREDEFEYVPSSDGPN